MMNEKYRFYLWPILKYNIKIKFNIKCIHIGLISFLMLVTKSLLEVHSTAYDHTAYYIVRDLRRETCFLSKRITIVLKHWNVTQKYSLLTPGYCSS